MIEIPGNSCEAGPARTVRKVRFTVSKANRALVLVRRVVADTIVEFRRLLDLQETVETAEREGRAREAAAARVELRDAFGRLERYREELGEAGVILRDWLRGVVHFPCWVHGKGAYLCWRHGEQRVGHWHPVDACYAERRPISAIAGHYVGQEECIHQAVRDARTVE